MREHPDACFQCEQRRPLIGVTGAGNGICGPCAGVDLTYACQRCGTSEKIFREQMCTRCFATKRLAEALGGEDATIPAHREDFHSALSAAGRPHRVAYWLTCDRVPALLKYIGASKEEFTHRHLDDLPNTPTTRYIRDVLVAAAVLQPRDDRLEALPRWADAFLTQAPLPHRKYLTPFAHWFLLHRIRRTHRHRPLRASTQHQMRSRLRRALELLDWLDRHGIPLGKLTQPELETWLEEGPEKRREVRVFITWARGRGLAGALEVPRAPVAAPSVFSTDEDQAEQLHRCLSDETMPLDVRTAGALTLLFGLQHTRLLELTLHDIIDNDTYVTLNLNGHRLPLPPEVGQLVRALRDQYQKRWQLDQTASTTPWLFPGQEPARPLGATYLYLKLRRHGIAPLASRNTARLALATDLPASVLADFTGTSISNATRWSGYAKRDWLDYIASRTQI
ncbi:hypothetical protein AB0D40_08180 [Streptomyces massasporeus]|uniref:hypothetical protein n=1 Tax=Streptomyces massasporeus TaxID=67324 RepID=UPI0033E5F573